jgi:hypothetical protein
MASDLFRAFAHQRPIGTHLTNSFSIVMWEIWARAVPWEEIECTEATFAFHLKERVTAGARPRLPEGCEPAPAGYFELMQQCWADKPMERPRFDALVRMLEARLAVVALHESREHTTESVL